jgi:hypothetical protein
MAIKTNVDEATKVEFLKKLESQGVLDKDLMKRYLGSSAKRIDEIVEVLMVEGLIEYGSAEFDSEGEIQISFDGEKFLYPDGEEEIESSPNEKVVEELMEPSTVEQLTEVLRYVRNSQVVPVTTMHFRNMYIELGFNQEQLNRFVKELEGAEFLKIVEDSGLSHLELTEDGYVYMKMVIAKEKQNMLEDQKTNAAE